MRRACNLRAGAIRCVTEKGETELRIVTECDNCGKPATFHPMDAPCFEEVEHLCRECYDAEIGWLSSRGPIRNIQRDRYIEGPLIPVGDK